MNSGAPSRVCEFKVNQWPWGLYSGAWTTVEHCPWKCKPSSLLSTSPVINACTVPWLFFSFIQQLGFSVKQKKASMFHTVYVQRKQQQLYENSNVPCRVIICRFSQNVWSTSFCYRYCLVIGKFSKSSSNEHSFLMVEVSLLCGK